MRLFALHIHVTLFIRCANLHTYLHMSKIAYVSKLDHVNAFTYVSKIYFICNYFTFAPGRDQMQISVCMHVNCIHVEIWPCEHESKICLREHLFNCVVAALVFF